MSFRVQIAKGVEVAIDRLIARPSTHLYKGHKYTKGAETDLAKTFARVRRQLKAAEPVPESANVKPLRKVVK